MRTVSLYKETKSAITSSKRRFSDPKWERAGVDKAKIDAHIKKLENPRSLSGKLLRQLRDRPLLTVYLLDYELGKQKNLQ